MKSRAERGETAYLLLELRKKHFSNQEKAAAHIRAETGVIGLTDSQYAAYEAGDPRRPFQPKHREAIESVWGPIGDQAPEPVSVAPAPPVDVPALLRAIERQHEQIVALREMVTELVTAIRTDRQGPPWMDDHTVAEAGYILSGVRRLLAEGTRPEASGR